MRRAVLALLLIAALPRPAQAAEGPGALNGIVMVDYKHIPGFKVGDWVRYRTKGESHQGHQTDYTMTVLIAGEEMWWGEKCFWIETRTEPANASPEITVWLVSYGIFEDSLPSVRFGRYLRKYLGGFDEKGQAVQQLYRRATTDIKSRDFAETEEKRVFDTLGVERVDVPKGAFDALRVKGVHRRTVTAQEGDSTIYYEKVESDTCWWSDQVPITRLVKRAQDNIQRRRVWLVGESAKAPLQVVERAIGRTELIDFGSGMKSSTIPESLQRPVSEQQPARAKPPRRPAGKRG